MNYIKFYEDEQSVQKMKSIINRKLFKYPIEFRFKKLLKDEIYNEFYTFCADIPNKENPEGHTRIKKHFLARGIDNPSTEDFFYFFTSRIKEVVDKILLFYKITPDLTELNDIENSYEKVNHLEKEKGYCLDEAKEIVRLEETVRKGHHNKEFNEYPVDEFGGKMDFDSWIEITPIEEFSITLLCEDHDTLRLSNRFNHCYESLKQNSGKNFDRDYTIYYRYELTEFIILEELSKEFCLSKSRLSGIIKGIHMFLIECIKKDF